MAERNHNQYIAPDILTDNGNHPDLHQLRKQAEETARGKMTRLPENIDEIQLEDTRRLLHELQVHQIELEMQNEELRRIQAEMEASHSNYSDLYDFAPIGYLTFDKAGLIREVNLTGAALLGIERISLVNQPFSAYIEKDDLNAFHEHCSDVLGRLTKQTIEIRLKPKGKTGFFALLESIVVKDHEGHAVAIRTAVSDITDRKQAVAALQTSEKHYRLLIENMLDGYAYCKMMYNKQGQPIDLVILGINSAFERLTGLKDVAGMKVTDVIPGIMESHPELIEKFGRVAATGRTEKLEIEFKPLRIWLSISLYSTEQEHFTAVFDNITERTLAGEAIKRQLKELVNLNEDLARFNRVAVDRELRMIELKKEINELRIRVGLPPQYALESEREG